MKKFLGVMFFSILLVTGCSSTEEKKMTCTRSLSQNGMKIELNYTVNYKGSTVAKVESIETVTSEDTNILETYKQTVENIYSPYKDLEYYEYDLSIEGNTFTSKAVIDYEHIDTEKMISIDSANAQIIKDGKINVDDMQKLYESVGASCTK